MHEPSTNASSLLGALGARSGAFLGRSWGAPGCLRSPLGAFLGSTWSYPERSCSNLEASDAHRKRKRDKSKVIEGKQRF